MTSERELRAIVRSSHGLSVLTGGQTGVDTAAARAALGAGFRVHLVLPLGFLQEDGPITAARRDALSGASLHELPSPEFRYRTWSCVYLSDAVVLIDPAGGDGCQETIRAASQLGRPLLCAARPPLASMGGQDRSRGASPRSGADLADSVCSFLVRNKARVLMIAGCRASVLASQRMSAEADAEVKLVVAGASRAQRARSG